MAMSNNIGGPNFNPGVSRLPNPASGTPAAETGAQFHTSDAVTIGNQGTAAGQPGTFTRSTPASGAETAPTTAQGKGPAVNNAPTVLTVGSLSETHAPGRPDMVMNGLGQPFIETWGERADLSREKGNQCIAGNRPFDN